MENEAKEKKMSEKDKRKMLEFLSNNVEAIIQITVETIMVELTNRIKDVENEEYSPKLTKEKKFCEYTKEQKEMKISDILHILGIPAHIKGYAFLREGIILCTDDEDTIHAVTKVLYPEIAKKFNTTSSRVERAIRHAIEISIERGEREKIKKLFPDFKVKKPTNSEFIATISDKLRTGQI